MSHSMLVNVTMVVILLGAIPIAICAWTIAENKVLPSGIKWGTYILSTTISFLLCNGYLGIVFETGCGVNELHPKYVIFVLLFALAVGVTALTISFILIINHILNINRIRKNDAQGG